MFRLFSAIGRMISNFLTKIGLKAEEAADAQFTKDVHSKAMAFELHEEKLQGEYDEFAGSLSEYEVALDGKRGLLDSTTKNKQEAQEALNGALAAYEAAQKAGDEKAMAEAQKDGTEFQQEVNRLDAREDELEAEIADFEKQGEELMTQLEAIQKEIANLPAEKAEANAEHISNSKLIEARERLMGLRRRADRSPLDAVRAHNKELAARAKVAGKIAGVDAAGKRDKYIKQGQQDAAGVDFQKLLKARATQKEQSTGDAPVKQTETTGDERPKI
jgi:chromosome segregation ATPase